MVLLHFWQKKRKMCWKSTSSQEKDSRNNRSARFVYKRHVRKNLVSIIFKEASNRKYKERTANSYGVLFCKWSSCSPNNNFPYNRLPRKIYESFPTGWGIRTTESGWINSECFYEYIGNYFIPYFRALQLLVAQGLL